MDQIYENAHVTICATSSPNCRTDFRALWNPWAYYSLARPRFANLPLILPDGRPGNIDLALEPGYDYRKEPLHLRGWCLQERMLARRILSLSSMGLHWQCQSARYQEGGQRDKIYMEAPLPELLMDFLYDTEGNKKELKCIDDLYEGWYQLVHEYCDRGLSCQSDKLPAIAALATKFATYLEDQYVAGLWLNNLEIGLGWSRNLAGGSAVKPTQYRGPTWSWIAIEYRGIWWMQKKLYNEVWEQESSVYAQVIRCEVQLLHPNSPFGEVRDAVLEIRSWALDFDWDGDTKTSIGGIDCEIRPDFNFEYVANPEDASGEPLEFTMCPSEYWDEPNPFKRPVLCFLLTDATMLMLSAKPDGTYIRIGHIGWFSELIQDPAERGFIERTVIIK